MKKLMIAAAVVCAAVMANAAATNWTWGISATGALAKPGTTGTAAEDYLTSGTAYLFAGLSSAQLSTIVESFADGSYTPSGYEQTSSVTSGGVITKVDFDDSRSAGTSVPWVMLVTTKIGDDDYLFVSDSLSKARGADGKNVKITFNVLASSTPAAKDAGEGYAGAGWYNVSSSVPEPTSGLLLLLGVAGLALKRKRA